MFCCWVLVRCFSVCIGVFCFIWLVFVILFLNLILMNVSVFGCVGQGNFLCDGYILGFSLYKFWVVRRL